MAERVRSDSSGGGTATVTLEGHSFNGTSEVGNYISANVDYTLPSFSRDCTDVVTPNFKARLARGDIINNPCTRSKITTTPPQPTAFYRAELSKYGAQGYPKGNRWDCEHVMDEGFAGGAFLTTWNTNVPYQDAVNTKVGLAVTAAHANASSTELSALMVAAEGRKSVDSMASIMRRVVKITKAARKLDFAYLRREISPKELSERYMELRYAIRPLVYDARGAMKALEESKVYKQSRATARGFAEHSESMNETDTYTYGGMIGSRLRVAHAQTNIRAGVLCDVQTSAKAIFGGYEFLETMWEIVPFSFIVDWFLNVGDTIASFTPSAGVRELASWVTIESIYTYSNSTDYYQNTSSSTTYNYENACRWAGGHSRTEEHYVRLVNPQLSFWPGPKVRLDSLKLLDLGIILKALTRR